MRLLKNVGSLLPLLLGASAISGASDFNNAGSLTDFAPRTPNNRAGKTGGRSAKLSAIRKRRRAGFHKRTR